MGLLNAVANKGRNGDTRMAHVTPGEVVIPREVAALRPDLVAHVSATIRAMGGNPNRAVVGKGRKNPKTGIEEFATEAEVTAAYRAQLGRAPDAGGLANWMGQDASSLAAGLSGSTEGQAYAKTSAAEAAALGAANDASGASRPASTATSQATGTVAGSTTPPMPNWDTLYRSTFARPADKGGVDYWTSEYQKNPNQDWGAVIAKNAQGQDLSARDDILGGKVDISKAWDATTNSLTQDNLTYDSNADRWLPPKVKEQTKSVFETPSITPSYLDIKALAHRAVAPNETVAGQMGALVAANSPYIQQQEEKALQYANTRGLLNSSMAASAGREAAINAALNIATPDAASFGRASDYNAAVENQGAMFNATERNKFASQQLSIAADAANQSRAIGQQTAMQVREFEQAIKVANIDKVAALSNNILANKDFSPEIKQRLLNSLEQKGLASSVLKDIPLFSNISGDLISAPSSNAKASAAKFEEEIGTTGISGQRYTLNEEKLSGGGKGYWVVVGSGVTGTDRHFESIEAAREWIGKI